MEAIRSAFQSVLHFLLSPTVVDIIDVTALLIAFVPALYYAWRIMFGNADAAEKLVRSKKTLNRVTLLCVLVILLHVIKVPVVMKVVAGLIIIIAAIFILIHSLTV
jgi:glucan phosphoethanolaminetransferase (alkaline phosphatase superfamily)